MPTITNAYNLRTPGQGSSKLSFEMDGKLYSIPNMELFLSDPTSFTSLGLNKGLDEPIWETNLGEAYGTRIGTKQGELYDINPVRDAYLNWLSAGNSPTIRTEQLSGPDFMTSLQNAVAPVVGNVTSAIGSGINSAVEPVMKAVKVLTPVAAAAIGGLGAAGLIGEGAAAGAEGAALAGAGGAGTGSEALGGALGEMGGLGGMTASDAAALQAGLGAAAETGAGAAGGLTAEQAAILASEGVPAPGVAVPATGYDITIPEVIKGILPKGEILKAISPFSGEDTGAAADITGPLGDVPAGSVDSSILSMGEPVNDPNYWQYLKDNNLTSSTGSDALDAYLKATLPTEWQDVIYGGAEGGANALINLAGDASGIVSDWGSNIADFIGNSAEQIWGKIKSDPLKFGTIGATAIANLLNAKNKANMTGDLNTAQQVSYQNYLNALNPPDEVKAARYNTLMSDINAQTRKAEQKLSDTLAARGVRGRGVVAPTGDLTEARRQAASEAYNKIYGTYNVPSAPGPANYSPSTGNVLSSDLTSTLNYLLPLYQMMNKYNIS